MTPHLVLRVVTKILLSPIILFAFYVQFHGDFSPGGGFQAGVIFGVAVILYALVFGLDMAKKVFSPRIIQILMALGVMIYAGVGYVGLFMGGAFLDYNVLDPSNPVHGQHYGIMFVEMGVGITVSAVMVGIFYAFAGRNVEISDEDW